MIFIISGLPGTGKTTLAKEIEKKYNFWYLSDWEIFNNLNININISDFASKTSISENFSEILINYILNLKDKDIVVDIEYTISPKDYKFPELYKCSKIVYLGFNSIDENTLFNLFRVKSNSQIDDTSLTEKIKTYIKYSKLYYNECQKYNFDYWDINLNRNEVIDKILEDYNYCLSSNENI